MLVLGVVFRHKGNCTKHTNVERGLFTASSVKDGKAGKTNCDSACTWHILRCAIASVQFVVECRNTVHFRSDLC